VSATVDNEFRAELRETARKFLSKTASTATMRPVIEDGRRPVDLEPRIAELGWLGVEVPESFGGLGGSFGDLALILHELGRVLSPSSFATTAALGVGAVLAGNEDQQATWLSAIAAGEAVVTAALTGPTGARGAIEVCVGGWPGSLRLDGTADFVPDLRDADAVVVAARDPEDDEIMLFLLPTDMRGLTIEPRPTVDQTRRFDRLQLDRVKVTAEHRLGGRADGERIRDHLVTRAALAVACDCVGGCERVLELTVEHLSARQQFGRPLGSFQALKHRCADILYATEGSRSAVDHAAARLGHDDGDVAVSVAKSYAGDAYVRVAQEGVQLHGGIGYTWEHDLHMHLKRARLSQLLFGDSAWHREVLARAALAEP
jgi:alkylation response protein AidB-like acyl-CoA dehydrogenase